MESSQTIDSFKYHPKLKNELIAIIDHEIKEHGPNCDLNCVDVSRITDMSQVFGNSNFNGDISKWDVSRVTNMSWMFYGSSFNGDISNWNVSNVIDMSFMFSSSKFNGDISNWNTSNVTDMYSMFWESEFNGDILNWDMNNVTNMRNMFKGSPLEKVYGATPRLTTQLKNYIIMGKRNIVVVSNIPEEDAVAWEFDFYFENDMELFEKSVCDKVDPSLIKKSTCSNKLETDDPDYYIVIKLSDEVKADLLTKWEQFCTDNNVHVIGM